MARVVTIDGPAGSGKSTVACRLADRLGWHLLDTGAMYRSVTLAALRRGLDLSSDATLGAIARQVIVQLSPGLVTLDGEDVTAMIRSNEVTRATRFLASSPSVRECLVGWQRDFAAAYSNVVTEGRDQGTIVFPDAFLKIYLTASPEERARRRQGEFAARGVDLPFETVLEDLIGRDAEDAARTIAPMKPADDAIIIDSSRLDHIEVVDLIRLRISNPVS